MAISVQTEIVLHASAMQGDVPECGSDDWFECFEWTAKHNATRVSERHGKLSRWRTIM